MRIESDGNVAIGHQNPSALLHVQNASVTDTKIIIESTGTNSYPALRLKNDARSYDLGIDGATDAFRIYDVTGTAERSRIDTSGRHLIGSSTSRFYAAKLQVQGASDSNYIMKQNTTAGDGNRARNSKFIYIGTKSAEETSDNAALTSVVEHTSSPRISEFLVDQFKKL